MFALSIVMLCGAVGLSIDGARVYGAKQKLQAVVDSAVLAAARRAISDSNSDNIAETFTRFVAASLTEGEIQLRSNAPDVSVPRRIAAELVADVPTILMPVLGFETVEIRARSVAEFGFTKLEIALALDNTGSMSGAKLDALKASANRLVDNLLDRAPLNRMVLSSQFIPSSNDPVAHNRGHHILQARSEASLEWRQCQHVRDPVVDIHITVVVNARNNMSE